MTCDELLRQLTEYEDGVLPGDVCEELQRHLAECEPCQALKGDLEALARICRSCAAPKMPEDVRRRLAERLGEPAR
ncbi:MAG: zf-HC2 domain-containing protein [Acidobacteriota bacterium]|jgi:anti-sigma factor (TIGR02949 family)|nr:zf-HC2 domain-containing protein [Acidobacteriota bacterium]